MKKEKNLRQPARLEVLRQRARLQSNSQRSFTLPISSQSLAHIIIWQYQEQDERYYWQ